MRSRKLNSRTWMMGILVVLFVFGRTSQAYSQAEDFELQHEYAFGQSITFHGRIPEEVNYEAVNLFFQVEGITETYTVPVQLLGERQIGAQHDLQQQPLRAFSTVTYWLEITLPNNEVISSPKSSFIYEDNRFQWRSREHSTFRVHWYEGDNSFAQSIIDVAELGLEKVQSLLPLSLSNIVDMYVYASAAEMRDTLQVSGKNWVGAHADPDLALMVVSLPAGPEQRLEMERQIPHELMHIMLFEELGPAYDNLPTWLNEGLASISEIYPNPDYLILINSAHSEGNLIPIPALCQSFPRSASSAYLAYAESTSFTRFLHQRFGTTGLEALLQEYANGLDCPNGIQSALGISLTQLETDWRQEAFDENRVYNAAENLLPWLVLMCMMLAIPLILVIKGLRRQPTPLNSNAHRKYYR